ncbi:hypothetical protein [Namhaeicola litoreus]|uniref:Outer membrane protein beta-barrel domain-containing protein n=1 Tax=Namhaeicola litoreus TaxID=1052145 RepID=A0ABW3XZY2_9FLAO
MKKRFLLAVAVFSLTSFCFAQKISKNAIGLRIGDNNGIGTEISYQRGLKKNRLEIDLGWRDTKSYDAFKLTGLYQWVWNLDKGFNWYAGVGGGIGSYDFHKGYDYDDESFAFAAGDLGIEYNFDIPLLISLDFRPELGFNDYGDDLDFDIAFGIRYQF